MKKISFLLAALFSLGVSQGYAQALRTVRTYYDLFSARPYEVYTVNARTGQKHGAYSLYMEDGTLGITMTYANGALNGPYRQYGFADGTLHKSWTRNGSKKYRACTYDEKGELESLYDYDGTLIYVFPGTEIVSQRIKPADYKGHYPYECYDREGNVIEKGKMDSDDNKLTVTKYENGRSVYERADNGDEYWIYPNGNRKAYASADRSYIVMYDEQERWIGCRSKEGYYCVYRYPNSSVKAKGEEDAAGNRIGKWYLYSETGRLSVEENGVVRKPTKEEKASHESYLQELVDAKR